MRDDRSVPGRATDELRWQPEAAARMKKVPFFVRPFARRRAEAVARERGLSEVTCALLDELKAREHLDAK